MPSSDRSPPSKASFPFPKARSYIRFDDPVGFTTRAYKGWIHDRSQHKRSTDFPVVALIKYIHTIVTTELACSHSCHPATAETEKLNTRAGPALRSMMTSCPPSASGRECLEHATRLLPGSGRLTGAGQRLFPARHQKRSSRRGGVQAALTMAEEMVSETKSSERRQIQQMLNR